MFQRKDPAQLQAQLQSLKGTSSFNQADGKEWKLSLDPQGNGSALIRFLPGKGAEGLPFVKLVNHFFKGTGKNTTLKIVLLLTVILITALFVNTFQLMICTTLTKLHTANSNAKLHSGLTF